MKPRFLSLSLCLMALLLFHDIGVARPRNLLKGIMIINYSFGAEKTVGGEQCKIDEDNFATSLQFVANQSAKLKIIAQSEQIRRGQELDAEADALRGRLEKQLYDKTGDPFKATVGAMEDDKYKATRKTACDYNWMPHLFIEIMPIELGGGCGQSKLNFLRTPRVRKCIPLILSCTFQSSKFGQTRTASRVLNKRSPIRRLELLKI
jgi:hypothetical protein